jgi:hypothetical protein
MQYELKRDGKVAVLPNSYWIPVTHPQTPRGVDVWVINRKLGVATRGQITADTQFTHWFPFPKFDPQEKP